MLTLFKRRADSGSTPAAAANAPSDAVQAARTRARRRLIGAAVLVAIGVIGFPLVFETQPRPIPVDVPIELPRKDAAPPLVMPPAHVPAPTTSASGLVAPGPEPRPPVAADRGVITESRDEAGREVAPPAVAASTVAPVAPHAAAASKPAPAATVEASAAKPAPEPVKPAPAPADSTRAKALLEGKAAPAAATESGGRYVVQVGAFADPGAARETRLKVEKLGLKTYTQVASTAAGDRIRVRVGPFATRDEADRALSKARSAGLSAVVLTL